MAYITKTKNPSKSKTDVKDIDNPVGAEKVSFDIDAFNERFFTDYNKAEAKYLEKADDIRQRYEKVDMERE